MWTSFVRMDTKQEKYTAILLENIDEVEKLTTLQQSTATSYQELAESVQALKDTVEGLVADKGKYYTTYILQTYYIHTTYILDLVSLPNTCLPIYNEILHFFYISICRR